jgi:hypothetical protein
MFAQPLKIVDKVSPAIIIPDFAMIYLLISVPIMHDPPIIAKRVIASAFGPV